MTATADPDAGKQQQAAEGGGEVRASPRRWLMLALFALALLFNAVPWMQYTVLTDVVTQYYGIGHELVEWTGLVFQMTAMVLILPAAWFLDKYGLRPALLVSAAFTTLGMALRVVGCWPQHFWAVLAGQAAASVATNVLISMPPRLAAVWFPADEVSSAMGVSVVANAAGATLGCALAPLTARAVWTHEENFMGFLTLNASLAALSVLLMLAPIFWLFETAPPLPPSAAQAAASARRASGLSRDYVQSVLRICRDGPFLLLLLAYNVGGSVFTAVTIVLNRDIVAFFPDRAAETGFIAMLVCLAGIAAALVVGVALDRTKRFKELAVGCFFGGLVSLVLYSVTIATTPIEVLYVVAALFGAFMTSPVPVFAWGVELTYPEPEGNPTSVLNWVLQPVAMVTTLVYSRVFSAYGPHAAHGMLVAMMVVGLVAQLAIPKRYRRREAELALAKAAAAGGADKPLLLQADKPLRLEADSPTSEA